MKLFRYLVTAFLSIVAISSCKSSTSGEINVNDPPTFVEMYVEDESSNISARKQKLHEPLREETSYDESIFGDIDFSIVVVTNGPNYDLLYSVELTDSVLGTCIYTDQSLLYRASSTIIVEADDTYTTNILLTIPGTSDFDSYLTDRTISLTKILFSRDTVDGTFPADIPDNRDTQLLFEVKAPEYFDATIGALVSINGDKVDVHLTPDEDSYDELVADGAPTMYIPGTINGYPLGGVYLQDLSWLTSLTIEGASDDIFILGNFTLLIEITIDEYYFTSPPESFVHKYVTINGEYPLLANITITDCSGFSLFIQENSEVINADYAQYCIDATELLSFPSLTHLDVATSALNNISLASGFDGSPFPLLDTVALTDVILANLVIGDTLTQLPSLTGVNLARSQIYAVTIDGIKDIEDDKASLNINVGSAGIITLMGSIVDSITCAGASIASLDIYSDATNPSPLTSLDLSNVTFTGYSSSISFHGDFPVLTTIALDYISGGDILIGNIASDFDALTSISLSNLTVSRISIGDRESTFASLETIAITNCDIDNDIRIGYENSSYPLLTSVLIENVLANAIKIGWVNDSFDSLETVIIRDVTLVVGFDFTSSDCLNFSTLVIDNGSMAAMSINLSFPSFVAYITSDCIFDNGFYISSACTMIYVNLATPTEWDYYTDAEELAIPVASGTYSI